MTGLDWTGLAALAAAISHGIYRVIRDTRKDQQDAIKEAEGRALTQARLEAVAREATAALEAKNRELDAVKDELTTALAECRAVKEGRG